MDLLVHNTMKNAAKCDKSCDLQDWNMNCLNVCYLYCCLLTHKAISLRRIFFLFFYLFYLLIRDKIIIYIDVIIQYEIPINYFLFYYYFIIK